MKNQKKKSSTKKIIKSKPNKVGRPAKPIKDYRVVSLCIDDESKLLIEEFGEGNFSEGVRRLAKALKCSNSQFSK